MRPRPTLPPPPAQDADDAAWRDWDRRCVDVSTPWLVDRVIEEMTAGNHAQKLREVEQLVAQYVSNPGQAAADLARARARCDELLVRASAG